MLWPTEGRLGVGLQYRAIGSVVSKHRKHCSEASEALCRADDSAVAKRRLRWSDVSLWLMRSVACALATCCLNGVEALGVFRRVQKMALTRAENAFDACIKCLYCTHQKLFLYAMKQGV